MAIKIGVAQPLYEPSPIRASRGESEMRYYFEQFHTRNKLHDAYNSLYYCIGQEANIKGWSIEHRTAMFKLAHEMYDNRLRKIEAQYIDTHALDAVKYNYLGAEMHTQTVEYACLITDKMYGEPIYTQGEGYMQLNMFNHKVIGVKFVDGYGADRSSKLYYYFTDDLSIKNDDFCIVIGGSGAPAVVKVLDDNVTVDIDKATRPIVCKIDTTAYFEKQKQLALRQAALKRLEELDREDKAMNKYADLASRNKEAAQLLQQLGMMDGIGGLIEPETPSIVQDTPSAD